MKTFFINNHTMSGSIKMRCYQIKDVFLLKGIDIELIENNKINKIYNITNSILFFFKYIDLVKKLNLDLLKQNNNIIIFDTIDITSNFESRLDFNNDFYKKFNYIITPSYYIKKINFDKENIIYIPHHYDPVLANVDIKKKVNLVLYNGSVKYTNDSNNNSIIDKVNIKFIFSFDDFINNIKENSEYLYHLSLFPNNNLEYLLKPITKVATASALDSIIICTKTDETLFWLGEDYPFYIDGTTNNIKELINKIDNNLINQNDLELAFSKMLALKKKLSIDNIVDEYYINLLNNIIK